MKLVLSKLEDIPLIMKVIRDAQTYLALLGIDQWQDGYPTEEQIKIDILNRDSYIILNYQDEMIGTTVFTFKPEPTYQKIDGLGWQTPEDNIYGVIHRLAVSEEHRKVGLAKFVFDECEVLVKYHSEASSLRIDTHKDNLGMQRLLKIRNYKYCGIIYLDNGDERMAYEKIL